MATRQPIPTTANNQLTQVQGSSGTTNYTYDANYNRTSMTTADGTTTYTYDSSANVELTKQTDPSGNVTTYGYDSNGNLTTETVNPTGSDQVTTFTYDQSNRLITVCSARRHDSQLHLRCR